MHAPCFYCVEDPLYCAVQNHNSNCAFIHLLESGLQDWNWKFTGSSDHTCSTSHSSTASFSPVIRTQYCPDWSCTLQYSATNSYTACYLTHPPAAKYSLLRSGSVWGKACWLLVCIHDHYSLWMFACYREEIAVFWTSVNLTALER